VVYDSVVMNISSEGCGLLLAEKESGKIKAKLHDPVVLECGYLVNGSKAFLSGRVMRIDSVEGKVDLGLRFDGVDETTTEKINRFIDQVTSVLS